MRNDGHIMMPSSYKETINSEHKQHWKDAMNEEFASLNECNVWKLVELRMDRKAIPVRWTYDIKVDSRDVLTRYKARLVGKGFMQVEGVDYSDVFSPVSKYSTVRLILALIAKTNWDRISLDIKTAFLNAPLDHELYVKQPEGFEIPGKEEKVYRLFKALYGLKQASRLWHQHFRGFLLSTGFKTRMRTRPSTP